MKKLGAAFLILAVLVVLLGIVDPELVRIITEEKANQQTEIAVLEPEKTEEDENDYSLAMIMNVLMCEEEDAKRILYGFYQANNNEWINIAFPLTIVAKADDTSNDLLVYDSDYVEYYVVLGKDYSVYMIKDVFEDRIIYALNE